MTGSEDTNFEALLAQAEGGGIAEDYAGIGLEESVGSFVDVVAVTQPVVGGARKMVAAATNGKKFKVKLVDGSSDLCFKFIREGASFCLKANCETNHGAGPTEGHHSFEPPPGEKVVVILKTSSVAFSNPVLPAQAIESDVLAEWEGQAMALPDWREIFSASNQGPNVLMSFHDIKLEVDASRNEAFQTPAKRKKKVTIAETPPFEPYSKVVPPQERSVFKRAATTGTVADALLSIDDGMSELSIGIEQAHSSVSQAQDMSEAAYRKAARVEGVVGSSQVMDDSEFNHPTLWGVLSLMSSEIVYVRSRPAPAVDLAPIRAELTKKTVELDATLTKVSEFTKAFSKSVLNRLGGVEVKVMQLQKHLRGTIPSTQVEDFGSLLAQANANQPVATMTSKEVRVVDTQRLLELEASLATLTEANLRLEQRFAEVIADNESDAIKFAGLGLRSVEETAAWVETNFSKRAYGLIFDVYLLLDLVSDEGVRTQKDMMTEMKRREELDIATEAEGQALTAFLCEVPRIFHTTTGTLALLAENASHFSKVPNFKAWSDQSGGLKKAIEKKLARLKTSLREVIASEFGAYTVAYAIAVSALEKSISWIGAFLSFIDQTYESLHVQSNFSSARAWALTTQLGRRIFADLHGVRVGTTKAMGKGRVAICPIILWAVFRTHDKMAAFEVANFEDHPSIASEYVKFLATNSGLEVVTKLDGEVASLKNKVKDLEKMVVLAAGKADKAASSVDIVRKQCDALARKNG
jgi:hypothetical protein